MCLASIEVLWELAASTFVLYYNIKIAGVHPYVSWDFVHFDFSRIAQYPRFLLPDATYSSLLFTGWIPTMASICFFIFFGTGEEAMKDYRMVIRWIRVKIFRQTIIEKDGRSQLDSLPTYSTSSRGATTSVTDMYGDKVGKDGRKPWENLEIKLPDLNEPSSPSSDCSSSIAPSYKASPDAIAVSVIPVPDSPDGSSSASSTQVDEQPASPPPARLAPSRFISAGSNGVRVTIERESDMV
jgi:pheromone a factor receptor